MTGTIRSFVNWKRLLIAAPVLAAVAVGAYLLIGDRSIGDTPRATLTETPPGVTDDVGVRKGELGRNFIGQAPDGSVVRLSDLRGRPTIINFWATWCSSCLAELPDFKEVQGELGADHLNVVAVNAGEGSADASRFLKDLDAPAFRVAMDPTLVISDAYAVFGMPTSLFLDADGVIRAVYVGQIDKDLMREYVSAASTGTTTGEPPTKIRLTTGVARDHTLSVDDLGGGRVELSSKSLRCDDSYCGESAIEVFATGGGIRAVERFTSEDPPRLLVTIDETLLDAEGVAAMLKAALDALGDPVYDEPLEIVQE
jgi:thiol-disulfide isomerase/thioredoxin